MEIINLETSIKQTKQEIAKASNPPFRNTLTVSTIEEETNVNNIKDGFKKCEEINKLKFSALSKVEKLEKKLEKSTNNTNKLKQRIRIMNDLLEAQGKELYRVSQTSKFEAKINKLCEFLGKLKMRARYLTQKLQRQEAHKAELKDNLQSISIKVSKTKTKKKHNVEIYVDSNKLKETLRQLNKILTSECDNNKKETRETLLEIHNLRDKLRELQETNQFTSTQYKNLLEQLNKVNHNKRNALSLLKERPQCLHNLLVLFPILYVGCTIESHKEEGRWL